MSRRSISLIAVLGLVISVILIMGHVPENLKALGLFNPLTLAISILGFIVFAVIFLGAALKNDGDPVSDIDGGEYGVVCMNVTATHVAVILKNAIIGGRYYEFPVESFNGEIIPDAKFLAVTISGNKGQFKKLHLVKSESDEKMGFNTPAK